MAETTALTTHIAQAELEELERLYTFRGRDEVLEFINNNPFLIPVLLEAPGVIRRYFENPELVLELEIDPETAGFVELFILIGTSLDVDKAMQQQGKFDQEWWLGVSYLSQGKLNIDIESIDEL